MERRDLYDADAHRDIVERIERLTPDARPQWGRMTAAQMLAHCAEVQEVQMGKELKGSPWYVKLLGPLFKGMLINERPYPRNLRTHPQYLVTDSREFEPEKARLLAALQRMQARGPEPFRHPIFGKMTPGERGWACYKHLDHHLTQFDV